MSTTSTSTNERRQAGMVAIMVTLILMIVISLIVLGFAQISRRTQRQALDRQLNAQAFYAAETGINDTAKLIKDALASGATVPSKPDCASDGGGFYSGLAAVLDAADNVEYTCVIVNPSPPNLVYSNIGSTGTIVPLMVSAGTFDRITLIWQSKDGTGTPATNCPNTTSSIFSTTAAWPCGYGVLRFDLVPTAGAGHSIGSLQANTMSTHVVPLRPGSTGSAQPVAFTPGANLNRLSTVCVNTQCSLTINVPAGSQYYMRVLSLYKDVSLQITASSAGTPVNLTGAQALIDVTGKAEDILRRVQVRLPLSGSSANQLSDYAFMVTRPVCKRYSVMNGYFLSDAENAVPGVSAVSANPLCN